MNELNSEDNKTIDNSMKNSAQVVPEVTPGNSFFTKRRVIEFVVVALVLVFGGWALLSYYFNEEPVTTERIDGSLDLSGYQGTTIYMSLRLRDGSVPFPSIYAFDFGDEDIRRAASQQRTAYHFQFSPDLTTGVVVGLPADFEDTEKGIRQLSVVEIESGEVSFLTRSGTFLKRFPQWSPDGTMVAFMAQPEHIWDTEKPLPTDAYSVYIVDREGEEQEVAAGSQPHWTPDGDLVYLKPDGVYLYDMETKTEESIWDVEGGETSAAMSIDVSPDGNYIVWAAPKAQALALMHVVSWRPFEGALAQARNDVQTLWPVFSEDSKYIAAQFVEGDLTDDNARHSLSVFSVQDLSMQKLIDLSDYVLQATTVSDWRTFKGE